MGVFELRYDIDDIASHIPLSFIIIQMCKIGKVKTLFSIQRSGFSGILIDSFAFAIGDIFPGENTWDFWDRSMIDSCLLWLQG